MISKINQKIPQIIIQKEVGIGNRIQKIRKYLPKAI